MITNRCFINPAKFAHADAGTGTMTNCNLNCRNSLSR